MAQEGESSFHPEFTTTGEADDAEPSVNLQGMLETMAHQIRQLQAQLEYQRTRSAIVSYTAIAPVSFKPLKSDTFNGHRGGLSTDA